MWSPRPSVFFPLVCVSVLTGISQCLITDNLIYSFKSSSITFPSLFFLLMTALAIQDFLFHFLWFHANLGLFFQLCEERTGFLIQTVGNLLTPWIEELRLQWLAVQSCLKPRFHSISTPRTTGWQEQCGKLLLSCLLHCFFLFNPNPTLCSLTWLPRSGEGVCYMAKCWSMTFQNAWSNPQ